MELRSAANLDVTWIHRDGGADEVGDDRAGDNAPIIAAVRAARWLPGQPQGFIHGEAHAVMHGLRAYLRKERGVTAARRPPSPWRRSGVRRRPVA